jgi:hypothetical protein
MFACLGLTKASLWRHAARRHLLVAASPEKAHISRRIWATPITASGVAILAAIGVPFAILGLFFIPLVARLLDRPDRRGSKTPS